MKELKKEVMVLWILVEGSYLKVEFENQKEEEKPCGMGEIL